MAPRASRSAALPAALAAVGLCAACHYSLSFAVPRTPVVRATQSGAFGQRQAIGASQTTRFSGAAAVAAPEPVEQEVPSVGLIAFQGLSLLAAITGGIYATMGSKVALQGFVGLAGLYVIMSVNEYLVHRYYQHLGINKTPLLRWLRKSFGVGNLASTGHVEHHAETLDDMTLDQKPQKILDADPFRGTAFSWSVTAVMTFEIALQSYPFLWLCGWSLKASTIALAVAMLLHAAVWQTLHPAMHELADPPLSYGMPGWSMAWLRKTAYFRFLWVNHEGHHRVAGAHGNYNVCCPLADHMFGTYVGIIPAKATNALCPAIA
mmetsp:Transcript_63508/g.163450  ORF Transcript_63508/g.163450 Transcript_63508/m.163450 type:complete len:320 (+) Transcript_63508:79-1038(+)|eukprot:CAMPEP_0195059090 /NCGR_PEP_ID=MMETSP0448-20130528/6666_1 /TAXON_ID=66468 /ORGANISM="Heterocapsa triquestra, Strain CCMP 448" /LENGTH=319 /DNA_ID=CAMNT_0040089299 /DNA_START=54 /DNA_END=1013 /DNA_ORIENTATION=-